MTKSTDHIGAIDTDTMNRSKSTHKLGLSLALLSVGLSLMLLNLYGLFQPLRPQNLSSSELLLFENDVTYNYETALQKLGEASNKPPAERVETAVAVIKGAIGHTWSYENRKELNLTIPASENYVLWTMEKVSPLLTKVTGKPFDELYQRYEYTNWEKALERGLGLCSQHAIVLNGYLSSTGIESNIVNLKGHVVNQANVDGQWWILDSDYGVVIPHELNTVSYRPDLIHKAYSEVMPSDVSVQEIIGVYLPYGNDVVASNVQFHGPFYVAIEYGSYFAKWLIPIVLIGYPIVVLRR